MSPEPTTGGAVDVGITGALFTVVAILVFITLLALGVFVTVKGRLLVLFCDLLALGGPLYSWNFIILDFACIFGLFFLCRERLMLLFVLFMFLWLDDTIDVPQNVTGAVVATDIDCVGIVENLVIGAIPWICLTLNCIKGGSGAMGTTGGLPMSDMPDSSPCDVHGEGAPSLVLVSSSNMKCCGDVPDMKLWGDEPAPPSILTGYILPSEETNKHILNIDRVHLAI